MKENEIFTVTLDRIKDYQFQAGFDDAPSMRVSIDEEQPLGAGLGPNAARLLGASIGYCLSASLLFCLEKSRIETGDIETRVVGRVVKNEAGRLRIGAVNVEIDIDLEPAEKQRAIRCMTLFEDYCIVTATLRKAIGIQVTIHEMLTREKLFTHKIPEPETAAV